MRFASRNLSYFPAMKHLFFYNYYAKKFILNIKLYMCLGKINMN
jgi:hypothetical protein